ncbi:MAG TPA: DUF4190 domain-containing protein [Pirellulaceae bacterium]|nr:DUF4190 domain-containing protein [Pirellulaceae bacterium]
MSQTPPPNWPQQPGGHNPFSDQGQAPFAPGGPYPAQYGPPPMRIEDDPAMRWVLPVGTSFWAIAAGYLGLFSLLCFPAPIAILFSLIAIWHLRRNPKLSGWGRAIFGLVMGVLFTLIPIITFIAIAVSAK